MINIKDEYKCNGCYACYNKCPQNVIEMKEDEKGFKYPVIDEEKCTKCGLCEKICPILNKKDNKVNDIKSYAAYSNDDEIRKNSSSGGIFSLLAEYILEQDGIVVGAAFDEDFLVVHKIIKNKSDLKKLRTSKYLQSNIGTVYKEVKELLNQNKKVLFTGTPCQINGLNSYLGKKYENLYTQDIICHGVPSPKVWKKYLEYRENKDKVSPSEINFREKTEGWRLFSLIFKYNGEKKYEKNQTKDLYMQAFLQNLCLRDSCYNCVFKEKNRISDITLADFWGIEKVLPEMDDNKGTSLVIINTTKGEELFDCIKEKTIYKESNYEESIKYNPSLYESVTRPECVDDFFEDLDKIKFDKLLKKYGYRDNIVKRVLRKIKKIIKRIIRR